VTELVRITAPHFCAGVVIGGEVAPILRYMRGWPLQRVLEYCRRKGWRVQVIPARVDLREV